MANDGTAVVTLPTDTQILITREFDAPRRLVYAAYTTPEHVRRWWASDHGTMTVAEIDLRVGGTWRYVMVTPDGFEVAFHGEYREIVPDERLVFTEVYEAVPEGEALNVVTFAEVDGRTHMTNLVECPDKAARDMIIDSGMEGGMQKAMDHLERVAISLA